jgi:hypothetical protein
MTGAWGKIKHKYYHEHALKREKALDSVPYLPRA